jgi:hypothetical protein
MIVTSDEWQMVRVFLDESVPVDFPSKLLLEMMQIARPYGRGELEAQAKSRVDLGEIVAGGVRKSRLDLNGLPHDHDAIHFDYVAGHRLKVSFYPKGLLNDEGRPVPADRGMPVIVSREFDMMYGPDALENCIRIALM